MLYSPVDLPVIITVHVTVRGWVALRFFANNPGKFSLIKEKKLGTSIWLSYKHMWLDMLVITTKLKTLGVIAINGGCDDCNVNSICLDTFKRGFCPTLAVLIRHTKLLVAFELSDSGNFTKEASLFNPSTLFLCGKHQ
ncbi:hypothetical protein V6N12_033079 [Hibiscus sabdariffa]|uniref:Uncharacterized protein n=1 Tax=Hibiscus sabdariffa TaxID=183260 RepID=A0ABR2BCI6_9ROSI